MRVESRTRPHPSAAPFGFAHEDFARHKVEGAMPQSKECLMGPTPSTLRRTFHEKQADRLRDELTS